MVDYTDEEKIEFEKNERLKEKQRDKQQIENNKIIKEMDVQRIHNRKVDLECQLQHEEHEKYLKDNLPRAEKPKDKKE